MRTAAGLPQRVVAVEDQGRALERHVAERLDEVRYELAEIRRLLEEMNEAGAEAVELTGRLLRAAEARLDGLEERVGWKGAEVALGAPREVPSA
jgi:hypothetical protein